MSARHRQIALDVLRAALAAVAPEAAIRRSLRRDGDRLLVGDRSFDLTQYGRVRVVGAGKASGAMAAAVEPLLGGYLEPRPRDRERWPYRADRTRHLARSEPSHAGCARPSCYRRTARAHARSAPRRFAPRPAFRRRLGAPGAARARAWT